MTIVLLKRKHAPLTKEEMDGNFEDLDARLRKLEDLQERSIHTIRLELDNDVLMLKSMDDEIMTSVTLPVWTFRGPFQESTSYNKGDVITHDKSLYVCIKGHDSTKEISDQHFQKMLSLA